MTDFTEFSLLYCIMKKWQLYGNSEESESSNPHIFYLTLKIFLPCFYDAFSMEVIGATVFVSNHF